MAPDPSPYADHLVHPADGCVFCRIIQDEDELVYADAHVAAFLDIAPLFPGHLLIVPRQHIVTLDQVGDDVVAPLFRLVQRSIRVMSTALGAEGAFTANNTIVSQSVLHAHVHVVPRTKGDGLKGFFWPRVPYRDDAHRLQVADALRDALR